MKKSLLLLLLLCTMFLMLSFNAWALPLVGEATPVPEPATMFLLGTGLVVFAGLQRRKKQ